MDSGIALSQSHVFAFFNSLPSLEPDPEPQKKKQKSAVGAPVHLFPHEVHPVKFTLEDLVVFLFQYKRDRKEATEWLNNTLFPYLRVHPEQRLGLEEFIDLERSTVRGYSPVFYLGQWGRTFLALLGDPGSQGGPDCYAFKLADCGKESFLEKVQQMGGGVLAGFTVEQLQDQVFRKNGRQTTFSNPAGKGKCDKKTPTNTSPFKLKTGGTALSYYELRMQCGMVTFDLLEWDPTIHQHQDPSSAATGHHHEATGDELAVWQYSESSATALPSHSTAPPALYVHTAPLCPPMVHPQCPLNPEQLQLLLSAVILVLTSFMTTTTSNSPRTPSEKEVSVTPGEDGDTDSHYLFGSEEKNSWPLEQQSESLEDENDLFNTMNTSSQFC